jgi:hypothetical protein
MFIIKLNTLKFYVTSRLVRDQDRWTLQVKILYDVNDVRTREGNSRNYWPVNSSRNVEVFWITENSKKYQITFI